MKNKLLSTGFFLFFYWGLSAQNVNIPDANFKTALIGNASINTNGDSEIQISEATAYTGSIGLSYDSISDLTGIEAFTALTYLQCSNLQLTSLNVSSNTALTHLDCSANHLTNLNISANTALYYLDCSDNQITNLDVTTNSTLTILRCYYNFLTSLNVSANTDLIVLVCGFTNITSLDVSTNNALNFLLCRGNNQLVNLNVKNGYNNHMLDFDAVWCPALSCIQVDDTAYSNTNWASDKDATAIYSTNCSSTVSINEMETNNDIVIYPNPTSGVFKVITNKTLNAKICVRDLLGNCVYSNNISNSTAIIDLGNQSKGIYFVEIIADKTRLVKKIVLN